MILNNTYKVETTSIVEALTTIESFLQKMELFESKYKAYSHDIEIKQLNDIWELALTIKNEKENIKVL